MPRTPATEPRPALRQLIREAMRAKGIGSVDGEQGLARRAGVTRNTIYAWESGAYPRIGELERLGRFLDVPAWRLLQAWEAGEASAQPDMVLYRDGQPVAVVETKIDEVASRLDALERKIGEAGYWSGDEPEWAARLSRQVMRNEGMLLAIERRLGITDDEWEDATAEIIRRSAAEGIEAVLGPLPSAGGEARSSEDSEDPHTAGGRERSPRRRRGSGT